jgi:drug/metabolite transporter (DMT)-like permease
LISLKVFLLILLSELWGIAGQIFYKKTVNRLETPNLRDIGSYMKFLKGVVTARSTWIGVFFILGGLATWLTVLAQANLTIAFPVDSMQYIVTLIAAHIFLGEKINRLKVVGTFLVVCGIILVAMS